MFLPGAWSTVPLVVGAQILALGALQAYAPRPRASWLSRVVAGIVLGTGVSALILGVAVGFQGISRMAFAADALLLSIAAIGWRGAWVLRARARARTLARASVAELVDRADEMTLGTVLVSLYRYRSLLKALVLKDLKLKYRGFGLRLSLVAGQPAADDCRLHARLHVHPRDTQRDVRVLPDAGPAGLGVLRQLHHDVDRRRSSTTAAC